MWEPFETLGLSPEDIVLLDLIVRWTWWTGLLTLSILFSRKSKFINITEIRDVDGRNIQIHGHIGFSVPRGNQKFDLTFCFFYNSLTNYVAMVLDFSHPIVGILITALSAYYSRILPFIISLVLIGQQLKRTLNLTELMTSLNRVVFNNDLGYGIRLFLNFVNLPVAPAQLQPSVHIASILQQIQNFDVAVPVPVMPASAGAA